ncbi:MAG TPA: 3-hydroxyacyl-CoA dehydrogenase [Alphaproteobacteria bacterium]|nr:3-hydroxyacyl-CoA dehydrogenase [Alphaproteobacteria bacterium]
MPSAEGRKIGIVGAGLIGRAWAVVFARAGAAVAVFDADPEAMHQAPGAIGAGLRALAETGLLEEAPAKALQRIALAKSLPEAVADADYVQESVAETLPAKRAIFAELDQCAAPQTILASSTSNIPGSLFSETLPGRARVLVAHPVNPPHLVPLVELVPTRHSDPDIVAKAKALLEDAGQVPIVVKREIEGFILNRLQAALLNEAFRLVEDGYVSTADLDKTIKHGLGLRWSFMGPFETIDLNAPGGVRDYVRRYAAAIRRLAEQQADPRAWPDDLVDRIEAERRLVLPAAKLAERAAWRDRRLAALLAHKRREDETSGI